MSDPAPIDLSTYGPTFGDSNVLSVAAAMNAQFDRGDMAWVLVAAVLVWIMIPGVGLLYAGLSRRTGSAALLWQSMVAVAVVSFQW